MKSSFLCGSVLLLVPAIADAQDGLTLEKAPPVVAPITPSQTPALDAFAGVGRRIDLHARWVQIDAEVLFNAFPAWSKLGASAWSHVATSRELAQLALMRSGGAVAVSERQLKAINNQPANLSFAPFKILKITEVPMLSESGPLDDMVIPLAPPPYIPNLAQPESKLPAMAPMPGAGGKNDPPFIAPIPAPPRPQMSRELAELMSYKFSLRPTLVGDGTFALELKSLNSANNIAATATANQGETVVFSLPNILEFIQSDDKSKVRRTFLLVTPRVATPQPRRDQTPVAPREFRFIDPNSSTATSREFRLIEPISPSAPIPLPPTP